MPAGDALATNLAGILAIAFIPFLANDSPASLATFSTPSLRAFSAASLIPSLPILANNFLTGPEANTLLRIFFKSPIIFFITPPPLVSPAFSTIFLALSLTAVLRPFSFTSLATLTPALATLSTLLLAASIAFPGACFILVIPPFQSNTPSILSVNLRLLSPIHSLAALNPSLDILAFPNSLPDCSTSLPAVPMNGMCFSPLPAHCHNLPPIFLPVPCIELPKPLATAFLINLSPNVLLLFTASPPGSASLVFIDWYTSLSFNAVLAFSDKSDAL